MIAMFDQWRGMRAYQGLPADRRTITFYSEGPAYGVHMTALVDHLLESHARPVAFLTSDRQDPMLEREHPLLSAHFLGDGSARTTLFRTMEPTVLVMSTPDLENLYLKRSAHPVHYVYVHHSLVSTHMVYNEGAFDHFDTIFCVGPHHVAETRARDAAAELPEKETFEHGYARLDAILAEAESGADTGTRPANDPPCVLIAPSWSKSGLLETMGEAIVEPLIEAGFEVVLRPHPMTRKLAGKALAKIEARWKSHPRFVSRGDMAAQDDLLRSDIMVSDWSGAALEYAFGLCRPVLFVDVPRKVNNPDYETLGLEPVEVTLRDTIGSVIAPDALGEAPARIEALLADTAAMRERIVAARTRTVFNPGRSAQAGAERLAALADAQATRAKA